MNTVAQERRRNFGWKQVRVTALLVIAGALLLFGAYQVGKVFDVFSSRYQLTTLVPNVLGLREGSPVTLAGQRIGQVKSIEYIPVERKIGDNNLRVVLAISEDVREQIRTDSRAYLRTQGLLGDKFVDIAPGSAGAAILQPGDTLIAGQTVDLEEFVTKASGALDQATSIVTDLRDLTGGLVRGDGTAGRMLQDDQLYIEMAATSAELRRTLNTINRSNGTFGRLLHDPTLYQRLTGAVSRVDSLGAMILYGNGSLTHLLRDDSVYRGLLGTVNSADSAVSGIATLLQRMTQGKGTLERLMTDPRLYDEFLKAITDVQSLINDIRNDPTKFKPNVNVRLFGGGGENRDGG